MVSKEPRQLRGDTQNGARLRVLSPRVKFGCHDAESGTAIHSLWSWRRRVEPEEVLGQLLELGQIHRLAQRCVNEAEVDGL